MDPARGGTGQSERFLCLCVPCEYSHTLRKQPVRFQPVSFQLLEHRLTCRCLRKPVKAQLSTMALASAHMRNPHYSLTVAEVLDSPLGYLALMAVPVGLYFMFKILLWDYTVSHEYHTALHVYQWLQSACMHSPLLLVTNSCMDIMQTALAHCLTVCVSMTGTAECVQADKVKNPTRAAAHVGFSNVAQKWKPHTCYRTHMLRLSISPRLQCHLYIQDMLAYCHSHNMTCVLC